MIFIWLAVVRCPMDVFQTSLRAGAIPHSFVASFYLTYFCRRGISLKKNKKGGPFQSVQIPFVSSPHSPSPSPSYISAINFTFISLFLGMWQRNFLSFRLTATGDRPFNLVEMEQNFEHDNSMQKNFSERDVNVHREKSNKCNQCEYASSYASALKTHLKKHTGEKSNKCSL